MIRLEAIELSEPNAGSFELLAKYAAVSDEGQTELLRIALKRAFDTVQRYADVALLAGRFRIIADDNYGSLRVYMGGKVESVTDGSGRPKPNAQQGAFLYVGPGYSEVVFRTEVREADYERLLPVVLKYATAVYDGRDAKELNQILKEAI